MAQTFRFHLLAYADTAQSNRSVRVTDVRRQKAGDAAELLVSLKVAREGPVGESESIPVQFEIDGARSELTIELAGGQGELKDHRIPLEKGRERGWGRVSIPADSNPADNDFWFVFEQPAPRQTIMVVEDPQAARSLQLAASISPDSLLEMYRGSSRRPVKWRPSTGTRCRCFFGKRPFPTPQVGKDVQAFLDRGGSAIFFPARVPGPAELLGVRWTSWVELKAEAPVESWRGDQDLLAHTASGAPLPVGQLQVRKACGFLR